MARPISWLPRVKEIRRTVADSTRSHYTRRELETLFQVQQGTASRLLDIVPTVKMNTGYLAEREGLLTFLDKVQETDDVPALMEKLRAEKAAPSRRRFRSLVRRDLPPVGLAGLPETLHLSRGHLEIDFTTLDELVTTLFMLARMLDDDLEEFARLYEPERPQTASQEADEVAHMFAELEESERNHIH